MLPPDGLPPDGLPDGLPPDGLPDGLPPDALPDGPPLPGSAGAVVFAVLVDSGWAASVIGRITPWAGGAEVAAPPPPCNVGWVAPPWRGWAGGGAAVTVMIDRAGIAPPMAFSPGRAGPMLAETQTTEIGAGFTAGDAGGPSPRRGEVGGAGVKREGKAGEGRATDGSDLALEIAVVATNADKVVARLETGQTVSRLRISGRRARLLRRG